MRSAAVFGSGLKLELQELAGKLCLMWKVTPFLKFGSSVSLHFVSMRKMDVFSIYGHIMLTIVLVWRIHFNAKKAFSATCISKGIWNTILFYQKNYVGNLRFCSLVAFFSICRSASDHWICRIVWMNLLLSCIILIPHDSIFLYLLMSHFGSVCINVKSNILLLICIETLEWKYRRGMIYVLMFLAISRFLISSHYSRKWDRFCLRSPSHRRGCQNT